MFFNVFLLSYCVMRFNVFPCLYFFMFVHMCSCFSCFYDCPGFSMILNVFQSVSMPFHVLQCLLMFLHVRSYFSMFYNICYVSLCFLCFFDVVSCSSWFSNVFRYVLSCLLICFIILQCVSNVELCFLMLFNDFHVWFNVRLILHDVHCCSTFLLMRSHVFYMFS